MTIEYRQAVPEDAELLVHIYNASFYKDWKQFTLVMPMDKSENVKFYTGKCGFRIVSTERDGNVWLARFVIER